MTIDPVFTLSAIPVGEADSIPADNAANGRAANGHGADQFRTMIPRLGNRAGDEHKQFFFGAENSLLQLFEKIDYAIPSEHFPLYIHGPSGCGKSNVAGVLAERVCSKLIPENEAVDQPNWQQVNATDFFREFVEALELQRLEDFRRSFLNSKVVVLDNLHELETRPSVFHQLQSLLEQHPRLVITSTRHPSEFRNFPGQIVSRLMGGLSIEISEPATETKIAFINYEIQRYGGTIHEDAAQWLAANECSSIPIIQQKISTLRIHLNLKRTITVDVVRRIFKSSTAKASLPMIAKLVAQKFQLKLSDLKSQSRKRSIVQARGIGVYIARESFQMKFEEIGRYFGNRDHSTVMHSYRKIKKDLGLDPELNSVVTELNNELTNDLNQKTEVSRLKKDSTGTLNNGTLNNGTSHRFDSAKPASSKTPSSKKSKTKKRRSNQT